MTLPQRVVVIESSGSGKSTLARAIAERVGVPYVELDALHWGPNWTSTPMDQLREKVRSATAGDGWVVDGNYTGARGDLWDRAELIIWLDYGLPVILYRLTRRTWHRCVHQELLWGGCRERWAVQLFTRDSIFWWVLTTWRGRRRRFPPLLAGRSVLRFRRPREAQQWLDNLR